MLSNWWGLIHWELLPTGSTITADLYCQQLDRVTAILQGKQDKVYFLHDNARPHIAKSRHEKLFKLGWIVVPHPPYSPDLAPTDYHLFRSLADHLREKKIRRRIRPQNGPRQLLQPKVPGFLRTWDLFTSRVLATSHRY